MKVLTTAEMYEMPNGTIFQEIDSSGTHPRPGLFVKNENMVNVQTREPIDFFRTPLFMLEKVQSGAAFAPRCYSGKRYDNRKWLILEASDIKLLRGIMDVSG